jgi:hypothetical protein
MGLLRQKKGISGQLRQQIRVSRLSILDCLQKFEGLK